MDNIDYDAEIIKWYDKDTVEEEEYE